MIAVCFARGDTNTTDIGSWGRFTRFVRRAVEIGVAILVIVATGVWVIGVAAVKVTAVRRAVMIVNLILKLVVESIWRWVMVNV